MKILVTGASGFIGGRYARLALEQGHEVRVNGRRAEGVAHLIRRGAQFVEGDLSDPLLAQRLCIGVDAVVHCAGRNGQWGRAEDFARQTVQTTENIVEGCLKEHVRRLVHLSCASLYRNGASRVDIKEASLARRFADAATRSRHQAERKAFGAAEFGLEVIVLRPATVVGAGDVHWLPRLLALQERQRLSIVGNGLNKVDFTSVHNVIQAMEAALHADATALGKAYNLSNGVPIPVWDVINYALRRAGITQVTRYGSYPAAWLKGALNELACRLWPGRPRPRWSRHEAHALNADFTLDISQARHHLGYVPQVTLWAALDECCAWWQAQGSADRGV